MKHERDQMTLAQRCARQWERHIINGQATEARREARRHTFPLVRVTHPVYGSRLVRAESNLDAVLTYARELGIDDWTTVLDANVWDVPKKNKHGGIERGKTDGAHPVRALRRGPESGISGDQTDRARQEGHLPGMPPPTVLLRIRPGAQEGRWSAVSEGADKLRRECAELKPSDWRIRLMAGPVCDALCAFCGQEPEFEQAVLQGGSFSECMQRVADGAGKALSDLDAYKRAVEFYFPTATVEMCLTVDLCPGDQDKKRKRADPVMLDITDFL